MKELWIKNNTGLDVSLSDLGVKVLANKTVNVYKYNPYLTEAKVNISMENGALFKRLGNETLSVTTGVKNARPHGLDHIKVSSEAVEVVKSKTSVFISTRDEDVLEDQDFGSFADYGFDGLEHGNTSSVRLKENVVVVKQKQDEPEDLQQNNVTEIIKQHTNGQPIVVTTKSQDIKATLIENGINPKTADTVSKAQEKLLNMKKINNMVVAESLGDSEVNHEESAGKSGNINMKKIGDMVVAENTGGPVAVDKIAAKNFEDQVATKDESGAIVMKMKEPASEPEPKLKAKTKPKKAKSKTKRKAKKTSKKTKK